MGQQVSNVVNTVVPVFALIMLGFAAGRLGLFVEGSARGLSTFVFTFAIPALLFKSMTSSGIPDNPPWALWGAFFGSIALIWLIAVAVSGSVNGLGGAGGSAAALGASFGNTVMLGLPLGVSHFGPAAVLPMALIISIHMPLQWFAATLLAQSGTKSGDVKLGALIGTLIRDLLSNPIVLAILAGSVWKLAGFGIHPIPDRIITMLSQGAIPAALFALGLSLTRFQLGANGTAAFLLIILKLAVMLVAAAALAYGVFRLPAVEAGVVVLFAALPTGANAYIYAERQGAAEAAVSASVAVGTVLSIFSLSIVLSQLPHS